MIRSMTTTQDGIARLDLPLEELLPVLKDPESFLWVDLLGKSSGEYEPILRDIFAFHPLAIDDALTETHIPKVDDWGEYLYLGLSGVWVDLGDLLEIQQLELDIFLGTNYIVSYHDRPMAAIETVWQRCQEDPRFLSRGTTKILYHLADELVNQSLDVIEQMNENLDQIEDEIFENPRPDTLNRIFSVKRALLQLRRTFLPQREIFNKMARGDFDLILARDRVYFSDLYDHMVRLQEINESLRDLISGTMDIYLSVVNNRMNDVMKTLTIITTVFMPLSFLTGFFGMNFFQAVIPLEVWTGKLVFGLVLAGMLLIPIGMYLWMRRRAWM